jgi:hypothetical protein
MAKNPGCAAAPPASADAILSFDEGRRLIAGKQVIVRLANFAKIPNSETARFSDAVSDAFGRWLMSQDDRRSSVVDVLDEVLDAANELRRLLQKLDDEHGRPRRFDSYPSESLEILRKNFQPFKREDALFVATGWLNAGLQMAQQPRKVNVADFLGDLSIFIVATKKMKRAITGRADSGRPLGVKKFPGLYRLVVMLEHAAQIAGGSFPLNKKEGKGPLLYALDWLRAEFLKRRETEWIGSLIPAPDQHPISTYARILSDARQAASKFTP